MDWLPQQLELRLPLEHPSYPGHFPGHPIVPGVLLLDKVVESMLTLCGHTLQLKGLPVVKFLLPLLPGDVLQLYFSASASGRIRFQCLRQQQRVASGDLEVADVLGRDP